MLVNKEAEEQTDKHKGGKNMKVFQIGNCCANMLMPDGSGEWHGKKCGRRLPSRSWRQLLSSDMRSNVCGPNILWTTSVQNRGLTVDVREGRPGSQPKECIPCQLKS